MKSPSAYYLCLLYLTVMLRPFIPLVSDEISHTFGEAYHVMTIHAKYGAHHVQKELASNSEDNTKASGNVKTEDPLSVHEGASSCKIIALSKHMSVNYLLLQIEDLSHAFIAKLWPPPKC